MTDGDGVGQGPGGFCRRLPPRFARYAAAALWVLAQATVTGAAPVALAAPAGVPARPGAPCRTDSLEGWTPQEKRVWAKICEGKIAELGAHPHGAPVSKAPEAWKPGQVLRPAFLETILLHEPFRGALTRQGVHIHGAWFRERLDLAFATLAHPLFLEDCRFDADVAFTKLRTPHLIELGSSWFQGALDLNSAQVGSDLLLRNADLRAVNLRGARIDGQLALSGAAAAGTLVMDSLEVGQSLFLRDARLRDVILVGARIGGDLDMQRLRSTGRLEMDRVKVGDTLFMNGGQFADVDLAGATIGGNVLLGQASVTGRLDLQGARAERDVLMVNGGFASAVLRGARIAGLLSLNGSKVRGPLQMERLEVGGNLLMYGGAEFQEVQLRNARIGGQVAIAGSTFADTLNMDSLVVGTSLFMREGATFADVRLIGARIGGDLDLKRAVFGGRLDMKLVKVTDDLQLQGADLKSARPTGLTSAEIGGNLDLSGSAHRALDLSGTRVHGALRLASTEHGPMRWGPESSLTLRGAEVGAIQDSPDAWPERVALAGFTYHGFEGLNEREMPWLMDWLGRSPRHSPQPYEHLARLLRQEGDAAKADTVLYGRRERQRRQAVGLERLGLNALKWTIGYGYRLHYALYWWAGLVVLGAVVLRVSGQRAAHGPPLGLAYSLDMVLPIIKLRERHYEVDLAGWPRYYFYLHKLGGYVLASFLIAGLSGLAQ